MQNINAREAVQMILSEQKISTMRFENLENSQDEIKALIKDTNTKLDTNTSHIYQRIDECMKTVNSKMDDGFKTYDAKFWGLAITIITMLGAGLIALIIKGHL